MPLRHGVDKLALAAALILGGALAKHVLSALGASLSGKPRTEEAPSFEDLTTALEQISNLHFPAMFVDLDAFDANVAEFAAKGSSQSPNTTIRVATKSLRVPDLLKRAVKSHPIFRGFMAYSVPEVAFLVETLGKSDVLCDHQLNDFLVAYPTMQISDLRLASALTAEGVKITLIVDCAEHVQKVLSVWKQFKEENQITNSRLRLAIDVDMSWRPFAGVHLGPRRSPVRTIHACTGLAVHIAESDSLSFEGIMGYEAHVAGLPDANPYSPYPNCILRWLKQYFFVPACHKFRQRLVAALEGHNLSPVLVNGGGTGSFDTSLQDPCLTEVTVGSGLLQSRLFDLFQHVSRPPALFFALQVTRIPDLSIITCQSGGFVASGSASEDKVPSPFRPLGLQALAGEGFGEVQTPLHHADDKVELGQAVFFRPAKAGEIAEHFKEYICLARPVDRLVEVSRVLTYRGHAQCFH